MYFFALEQLCEMAINWIDMDLLILLLIHLLWLLQLQEDKKLCQRNSRFCDFKMKRNLGSAGNIPIFEGVWSRQAQNPLWPTIVAEIFYADQVRGN